MWCLYCNTGELKYQDRLIERLSYSETIVLSLLISQNGQLVIKDTLLDQGWPNKIVTPNSLTVAIKKIRKALNSIDSEIYIETVYRRGYILHQNNDFLIITEDECQHVGAIGTDNASNINERDATVLLLPSQQESNIASDIKSLCYDNVTNDNCRVQVPQNRTFITLIKCIKYNAIFYYCALSLSAILSFVVFFSKEDIYCIALDNARACGVFKLPEYKKQQVTTLIGERTGIFLYGYNNRLDDIEVYQVDNLDSPFLVWLTSIH